jgi:hypothetical protein
MLLAPAGCRRPSADVSVDPNEATPDGVASAPACDESKANRNRQQPPPGANGDYEPPTVIGGRFVARDRIQLSFSEPLGPVGDVNPRQFRLSTGYSRTDYQAGYANGYYYDLNGNDTYLPPLVVIALESYDDRPEVLALQLNGPIPPDRCIQIRDTKQTMADEAASAEGPLPRTRIGLFLHYTSRGSVGIRDKNNNPMSDMGGEWALHFGTRNKNMTGTEPVMRLDLLLELDCPNENMANSGPPGPT